MKTSIIIILFCTSVLMSQNIYDLSPGTKGNKIILSLTNISDTSNAEGISVPLIKESPNILFSNKQIFIEKIRANEEKEVAISFDVKREATIGDLDTIEFMIMNDQNIFATKQFIFNYLSPKDYKLEQNFPNPFNPTTTIDYQIPKNGFVTLKLYDILGKEIATLVNEQKNQGRYTVNFDASKLSSGVYIYQIRANDFVNSKKMMLVK